MLPLLSLNALIAIMGSTYNTVSQRHKQQQYKEWAQIIGDVVRQWKPSKREQWERQFLWIHTLRPSKGSDHDTESDFTRARDHSVGPCNSHNGCHCHHVRFGAPPVLDGSRGSTEPNSSRLLAKLGQLDASVGGVVHMLTDMTEALEGGCGNLQRGTAGEAGYNVGQSLLGGQMGCQPGQARRGNGGSCRGDGGDDCGEGAQGGGGRNEGPQRGSGTEGSKSGNGGDPSVLGTGSCRSEAQFREWSVGKVSMMLRRCGLEECAAAVDANGVDGKTWLALDEVMLMRQVEEGGLGISALQLKRVEQEILLAEELCLVDQMIEAAQT